MPGHAKETGSNTQVRILEQDGRTRVEKIHGCGEIEQLWTWRKIPWPSPEEVAGVGEAEEEPEDWRVLAALAGVCGLLGISAFFVQLFFTTAPAWLVPTLYLLAMVAGGWDAARDAMQDCLKANLIFIF